MSVVLRHAFRLLLASSVNVNKPRRKQKRPRESLEGGAHETRNLKSNKRSSSIAKSAWSLTHSNDFENFSMSFRIRKPLKSWFIA